MQIADAELESRVADLLRRSREAQAGANEAAKANDIRAKMRLEEKCEALLDTAFEADPSRTAKALEL